ncbi:hypothetical protein [Dyella sp. GSA-30]|uniref:hypothetical protein n=1 Tax=Dyella sp. GSA-30 TaxID=2994496 RepID=UPI00248FC996|nr:hypothetical protein [Dyella sp. GSA-30]
MRRRWLFGGLVLAAVLAGMAWWRAERGPDVHQTLVVVRTEQHRVDAGAWLSPDNRGTAARQLDAHDGFERDLLFLFNSSLYGRCHPEHAHDIGRMAVAARLPVLDAMAPLWHRDPSLRDELYRMIRSVVAAADCDRPLSLVIGNYATTLQPARYAAFFPDSYFDPGLSAPPDEFAGRSLAERVADSCTAVGYAVLPLGGDRSWVCLGARASMRRHVIADLCGSISGRATPDAPALARLIDTSLQVLPPACR